NGRNPFLSGIDGEIAALHCSRLAQDAIGSRENKRCYMSCSPYDLRDYLFGELAENERRQVDLHLRSCGGCHEDFDRPRVTHASLMSLRDEELPQRIGFVSDKIF